MRLVTEFLEEQGIEYKHNSASVGMLFYEHGCRVKINDVYQLSVQTHPDIAGPCFAETALQNVETKKIVCDGTYGYCDVERWDTPDDLFDHIRKLLDGTTNASTTSTPPSD